VNPDTVREAIHSSQPAPAALAALVAFHALRSSQLASLGLCDIRDGRLHLDGRIIPLAALIRDQLTAWPAERAHPRRYARQLRMPESREVCAELVDLRVVTASCVARSCKVRGFTDRPRTSLTCTAAAFPAARHVFGTQPPRRRAQGLVIEGT
jgi:integrase